MAERVGLDYTGESARLKNEHEFLEDLISRGGEFPTAFRHPCTRNNKFNGVSLISDENPGKLVTTNPALLEAYQSLGNGQRPAPTFPLAGLREKLRFNPKNVRSAIVTAGGVAPGLNSVIDSIVRRHVKTFGGKSVVYGIKESFQGASNPDLYMERLDPDVTKTWSEQGGSKLGMRRRSIEKGEEGVVAKEIAKQLMGKIDILYVIGGNGSLSMAHEIAKTGPRFHVVGVPKTMDNDVFWVSESFGFKTAVENTTHIIDTLFCEAESSRRICLIEIFGAESGFVAAQSALASGKVDLVMIPEAFDGLKGDKCERLLNRFAEHLISRARKPKKQCAVAVIAEGTAEVLRNANTYITNTRGEKLCVMKERRREDGSKEKLFLGQFKELILSKNTVVQIGNHSEPLGVLFNRPEYYVRATPPNPGDKIFCDRLGAMAVDTALAGYTDVMVSEWHNSFVVVPLKLVYGLTKRVDVRGDFWNQVLNCTQQPQEI